MSDSGNRLEELVKTPFLTRVKELARRIFVHNWWLKLFSLVLAVVLWAALISQDQTLTREKIFNDAVVTVTGRDSLLRNSGFVVVSGLEEENLTVRIRAEVPQGQYASATYANYSPRVDLSRITAAGEYQLKVNVTASSAYGTVTSVVPDSIPVVVDEYVTNYRIPVYVNQSGNYPSGWGGSVPSTDVTYVAVSGPKTLVDQVSRVQVDYSVSDLSFRSGTVRTALPFVFSDAEGNAIESDLLEASTNNVTLRSIAVSQTLFPLATLALDSGAIVTGSPANGYQVTGVEISPRLIRVGGSADALSLAENLFLEHPVSVSGATESFSSVVSVRKPSEISYLSTESVTVTVTVEPIQGTKSFSAQSVTLIGAPSKTVCNPKNCHVTVSGPVNQLSTLKSSSIKVYADCFDLAEGTHTVSLYAIAEGLNADLFSFEISPAEVTVTIPAQAQ